MIYTITHDQQIGSQTITVRLIVVGNGNKVQKYMQCTLFI